MKRALVGRCGAVVAAVFGLAGCGDDPESSSEQGVDALETGSGADAEAAAAAEAEANAAAQADFYGLGRRVEIEVELDPADWAALRQEGRSVIGTFIDPNSSYAFNYYSADVTIDGQRYEDVAVRKKGYLGSLSADRPSIKLNLDRDGRGLEHIGLDEITLNNDRQDPSHSHQCLAYGAFAAAGLPASRCGLAHVVVNGEDLGTYTNVEPLGKPMLARFFDDNDGNLYEGQIVDFNAEQVDLFQLKTNEEENDRGDLERLVAALDGDDAGLVERLSAVLDLDAFRSFWALETLIQHWDGYAGNANNFYVYHDPGSDRFVFLPWGTDGAFQAQNPFDPFNTSIAVYARGRIANRLYNLPEQRQAFRERLGQLVDEVWVEERMNAELDRIEQLAVDAPPDAIAVQRELIATHGGALRAELAGEAPDWIDLPPPGAGPANACTGGEISGSFATTWGSLEAPAPDTLTLEASIDGQPLQATGLSAAGVDALFDDGIPRLRLLAPLTETRTLVIDIQLTDRSFKPGATPFHGLETVGFASVIDAAAGADGAPGGFLPGGFVGDGRVELEAASMEPGAPVTGRFTGQLLQFGCFTQ